MTTSDHIVRDHKPVTLLGGGEVFEGDIGAALTLAPTCVAADSGAALALAAGASEEGTADPKAVG